MMVLDLECRPDGHRFEAWFPSNGAFVEQQEQGLVSCPSCGSADIAKALTAPRLARKGNQLAPSAPKKNEVSFAGGAPPAEAARMLEAMARMQAAMLEQSRWVGDSFAEDVRSMHYGENNAETIHGQATAEEARGLLEEGIAIMPLPFPVASPGEIN